MIVLELIDEIDGVFILLGAKPSRESLKSLEKHSVEALKAMRDLLVIEFEDKNPGKKVLTLS